MSIDSHPSPNYDERAEGAEIDMLILHYTGMPTAEGALARLCDPAAKVSAHYLIDEEGTILRLVEEGKRAWHAGVAAWDGKGDVNSRSIGIELVNPGHEFGYRAFPEAQIEALEALAGDVLARHPIPARHVLGHSDVAPDRKRDPGEKFPWDRLAAHGIGLYPEPWQETGPLPTDAQVTAHLAAQIALLYIGYELAISARPEPSGAAALAAFQRHFMPEQVTGLLDEATSVRLFSVMRLVALDRGEPWIDF